jgi:hypothetical protein
MKKILYHGSDKIVKKPLYGIGKEDNDYGSGFYTTEDIMKAKEWASVNGTDVAICNKYELNMDDLSILNLNDFGTLAWISEVIYHRGAKSNITEKMGNLLIAKYKIDTSAADVIIGYRADDSYTDVVEAFLYNRLSVTEVSNMFRKGNLGEQVFIKSEKAFNVLTFCGYENVKNFDTKAYVNADSNARREVVNFLRNREEDIELRGIIPNGILARDAINNVYEYIKDYDIYTLKNSDGTTPTKLF